MSRGITLRGAAAAAFIEGAMGKKPKTDNGACMRIATYVYMEMARRNKEGEHKAALVIKCLVKEGIDYTLDVIEGRVLVTEAVDAAPAAGRRKGMPKKQ